MWRIVALGRYGSTVMTTRYTTAQDAKADLLRRVDVERIVAGRYYGVAGTIYEVRYG